MCCGHARVTGGVETHGGFALSAPRQSSLPSTLAAIAHQANPTLPSPRATFAALSAPKSAYRFTNLTIPSGHWKKKESATRSPGRRPPGWYHDVGLGCRVPAGARHPASAFENWLKMTPNEPRVAGQPDWPDRHFGPLSACEVVPKPQPDYRTNPIPVVTFSSAPIESAVYLYGYVTAHPAASDTMRRSPE